MAFPRAFSVRQFSRAAVIALFSAAVFAGPACEKVPLLAPSGSAITLTAAAATTTDQEVPIGVLVQEVKATTPPPTTQQGGNNNATPTTGGGTPVHDGTLVTFTVTGGTIAPPEARTVNGRIVVTFIPDAVGKFKVTARSGTAQSTHDIEVIAGGGGQ